MHGWKSAGLCPWRQAGPLMLTLAGPGKRQARGRSFEEATTSRTRTTLT